MRSSILFPSRRAPLPSTWVLLCALSSTCAHAQAPSASQSAPLPPASEYVQVGNGHLSVNGARRRYWAAIGGLYVRARVAPTDTPEQRAEKVRVSRHGTDVILQHLIDVGFNAVRLWDTAPNQEYTPGDGSPADSLDYFVAQAKKRGFKIWTAGLNNVGRALPDDASIINEPATSEAWREAVGEKGISDRNFLARAWDARMGAIYTRNMKAVAQHRNHHTGLRWSDDPVFGVWELSNEEWWMRRMVGGQWQKLDPFFRNQLIARWNSWLRTKYKSDSNLRRAWNSLLPGESLSRASILFAPMAGASPSAISMNDANPVAREALGALKQEYSRQDFSRQRASDVIAFLLEMQLAHKKREAAAVKSWGRGTALSPLIYDTGIGYEIQSQYLHQQAEATAHDAYVNGTGPIYKEPDLSTAKNERDRMYRQLDAERVSANAGPWVNWLLKPPGISQGVPWLEHNRVQGQPFLCYETQIQQPAKYRADFPLRIAALASIQDWDFVCWHYFGSADQAATEPKPFERAMDITTGSHPQGYHFTYDEVQNSLMRAAGWMFRHNQLRPAPSPTRFIYGRNSLLDPETMQYAGSYGAGGMDMLQTTYQHGVRIEIDPSRPDDRVIGPVVKFDDRLKHNPYTPTEQITFDWKTGFLRIDAPGAAAWTGLLARYGSQVRWKNGVVLRDVSILNPPGIYEPMREDEKYIAFALHTLDNQPLAQTRAASISLQSTSYNTGFRLGDAETKAQAGTLPVLVARVGATIESRALNGMKYVMRDWNMAEIASGTITNNTLRIPSDLPVFVVELRRE